MEEIWRDIIIEKNGVTYDYSGLYEVSNYGRVRSLDRVDSNGHKVKGRIMQYKPRKDGYVKVGLRKNGEAQQFFLHRLVANAFIPNPKNLPVVNHLDENPSNNVWTNLEWCTQKHNVNYGTCIKRASEKRKGQKRLEETRKKMSEARKDGKNPKAHKVICVETGQIFNCIKEAEQWCGKKGIEHCCKGRQKSAGGYHWQYYEDYKRQLRMNTDINNSMAA